MLLRNDASGGINGRLDAALSAVAYHHDLSVRDPSVSFYIWEQAEIAVFDELIISWNAMRPQYGTFKIFVSVTIERDWSPWLLYSEWGSTGQKGGEALDTSTYVKIEKDILCLTKGYQAAGFRVKIEGCEGAEIEEFYSLHACVSLKAHVFLEQKTFTDCFIELQVPLISQMALIHPRCRDMCSPVSTSAVVSYLLNMNRIDPVFFALQVKDEAFDIFGNWVLNAAHAGAILGKGWHCWVERLSSFETIYRSLLANVPVVVSVQGQLPGSAFSYEQGHLLVVKGYDPHKERVLCMDPAFIGNEMTDVSYKLNDFLEAWSRRKHLAYLFKRVS